MTESTVVLRLIKQLLWILFIYTILRFEFLAWNWTHWYSEFSFKDLVMSFVYGLRFDLSIIVTLSSVLVVAALLPWPGVTKQVKSGTITVSLALLHSPFIIFNALDVEFINFVGRRFSTDSLFLTNEIGGKCWALFQTYWLLILFNFLLYALFLFGHFCWCLRCLKMPNITNDFLGQKFKRFFLSLGIILLAVVFARGGVQKKPLSIAHITTDLNPKLVQLSLNSSFTFLQSARKSSLKMIHYFSSIKEVKSLLNGSRAPQESYSFDFLKSNAQKTNVMIIILESFNYEYFDKRNTGEESLTPFLLKLAKQGLFFKNAYAGGRRSIEAPVSIFMGIPSLMDEPFVTSQYSTVETPKIIRSFKDQGYSSSFFHGGQNGTMFFNETALRVGFEKYFGASEYPNSKDSDEVWGIWDEPFFNWVGWQLKTLPKPFITSLFTLSSHHPFKVPIQYDGKFPKGTSEIHQTIAYTDYSLEKFFHSIESEPWYKNTLFIITADHTSKSVAPEFNHDLGGFRIPLILYKSGAVWPKDIDTDEPVQQIDILPTLSEIAAAANNSSSPSSRSSPPQPSPPLLARSLFRKGQRSALLYLDNRYWLVKKDMALKLENDQITTFSLSKNHLKLTKISDKNSFPQQNNLLLQNELKASIQYFNNSLITSDLQLTDH
jgi:phosphoglycerol transferase MdoB-like AlkP superfamily enzyme